MKRNVITGMWGEHAAFQALLHSEEVTEVEWLNKDEEQRLPYDIVARTTGPNPRQLFYEVKSTVSPSLKVLNLSVAEVEAARKYGAAYYFVVVRYDKRLKTAKMVFLKNWMKASVTLQLPLPQAIHFLHK